MSVQPTAAVLLLVCSLLMMVAVAERNPTTAVEKDQGRLDVPEGVLPSDRSVCSERRACVRARACVVCACVRECVCVCVCV